MIPAVEQEKKNAALKSLDFVQDGMRLGLGSGSTASYFIRHLGHKIRQGLKIEGAIPTSEGTRRLALEEGIPLSDFERLKRLDLTIDGTDEVDARFNLIKGGGGALFREKLVASVSHRFLIIADSTKQVATLGAFPVPVEVVPFGWQIAASRIAELGAQVKLRRESRQKPYQTDQGNFILDCLFGEISEPMVLARKLDEIIGILEHGLFVGMADILVVGSESSARVLRAEHRV